MESPWDSGTGYCRIFSRSRMQLVPAWLNQQAPFLTHRKSPVRYFSLAAQTCGNVRDTSQGT
jgi:hypothetical protein